MFEMEIRGGVCIYAHYVADQLIYIGMGTLERAFRVAFRPKAWQEKTKNGYRVVILCWFDNRKEAAREEKKLIKAFNPTCNLAHSVNYVSHSIGNTWNIGRKLSKETKLKLSVSQKLSWEKTKRITGSRKPTKPIQCLDTGMIYSGLRDASRQTGACPSSISQCLNGFRRTAGGLRFQRLEA